MRFLDKSIEDLVNSYHSHGLVNQFGGQNLPSRESVTGILQDLEELLFPGFRKEEALDHDNLALVTAEKVYRIARNLIREVEKSMAFALRIQNKALDANDPRGRDGCHFAAELVVDTFFEELPQIRAVLAEDMKAAFRGDPAAKSFEEVIVSYPGFEAVTAHRLAHFFWQAQVPVIPRMISELIHSRTGIDIHPGAQIGEAFFIDHGTGVVIGETTIIGNWVKLYQGVTLGAVSFPKDESGELIRSTKRHPTLEDNVVVYANATILGGKTVVGKNSIVGSSVWLTHSLPSGTTIMIEKPNLKVRNTQAEADNWQI
jgi:serine O-acetyltransferase